MKKFFLMVFIVGLVFLSILAGKFFYQNFHGIGPAVLPSTQNDDIVLEKRLMQDATNEVSEGNTTGLPFTVPAGFSISIYAKDLGSPRVLQLDPQGTLLASIPSQGKVVALTESEDKGKADNPPVVVVDKLNKPHGIAFHPTNKKLYIAETDQVAVYDYDTVSLKATNKKKIIDLPAGGNHFSRTIGFGPDGRLYISVGSSCNVCVEKDSRRAKILVANADGSDLKEYASGLRNSVFFNWHPVSRELWATDMGRDLIGDDIPPDEINIIRGPSTSFDQAQDKSIGQNPVPDFGWPYCYGKKIHDTTFENSEKANNLCENSISSHIDLQAHSAPLGLTFIPVKNDSKGLNNLPTGSTIRPFESWPKEYRNDLLVAYHGSWNRSTPTGYKVVRMKLDEKGNYLGVEDFITGWLENAKSSAGALSRPVDLLFDNNGNLYVSDDKAGVVYSVWYPGLK